MYTPLKVVRGRLQCYGDIIAVIAHIYHYHISLPSALGCPEIQGVLKSRPEFFPNRLIMGQDLNASLLYTKLEETTRPRVRDMGSMSNVRSEIELILRDKKYLKQVNHSSHLRWKEKIAVRRMMSHYWDNSSNFGLDLVGAVIRQ